MQENEHLEDKNKNNEDSSNIPKSLISKNTYKDFNKICRAYYNELLHISKEPNPSLSKNDVIVIDDLIREIIEYSEQLIQKSFINEGKKLIDIGLVISDFLLKIFGEIINNNKYEGIVANRLDEEKISNAFFKYPLSLKLSLLESNFNILFKYEENYVYSEKTLNEIIEIQSFLYYSNYNMASSKFYLGIIKFFNNQLEEALKLTLEAKDLLEDTKNEIDGNQIDDVKKTKKMSNILNFLGEIYLLKKDYKNALSCYENAFYLNLGRFGVDNVNTKYFKNKLNNINEDMGKYSGNEYFFINSKKPSEKVEKNVDQQMNSFQGNIMHKGKADTFSFKIPSSLLYDPLVIFVYKLGEDELDRYNPNLFVGNICFNKMNLLKFLKIKDTNNNALFYTDDNLNKILINLSLNDNCITIFDKNLKNSVIMSSVSIKSY